ncbi:MAG: Terminase-like family protein [Methanosaeta sp. PtaB.Bin018]|nr:MAG: Terminase-like family protein [Methanosaeta sp. PtaB.Bin018]OPY48118.1 MAG: Terminase-like family protein [Methanosaeta sp. PtaU1.Bin016]
MLCHDLKAALDPVTWSREALELEPDPWQAEVLRSDSKRILLNCSRQSGKSTVTSILALHTATYQEESLVLCLSPTLRQSSELFRNVSRFYGADPAIPSRAESALRLELENGSRIVSLPGKEQNIRGMAKVNLLIVDEAARVPDSLYYSVRPMLAVSNGRLIALSTPFGNRGWWAEAWHSPEPWQRWEVPASKCPRIPAAFLEEERRVLGSWWFDQEYGCRFLDSQSQLLKKEDVDNMFVEEVSSWNL